MTYFSACHAGCESAHIVNNKTIFSKCECISDLGKFNIKYSSPLCLVVNMILNKQFTAGDFSTLNEATNGYCDGNCQSFLLFILLFSFFVFMHSTSEVGSMLLIMRCTDPKGKQSVVCLV